MWISFQRGAFLSLQGICHAPNTLTSRLQTGGTAEHNRSYHLGGCPEPNCKEDRRDSSHSKVMRLFEKRSACLNGRLSLLKRCPYKFECPRILSRYTETLFLEPLFQFVFCLLKCLFDPGAIGPFQSGHRTGNGRVHDTEYLLEYLGSGLPLFSRPYILEVNLA
jgi:hypothetical protein